MSFLDNVDASHFPTTFRAREPSPTIWFILSQSTRNFAQLAIVCSKKFTGENFQQATSVLLAVRMLKVKMRFKLLWIMLCVAVELRQTLGTPIKRTSPISVDSENILEEIGDNFEGDMILSPEQETAVREGYTAKIDEKYRWPNNVVYYSIDTSMYTADQQNNIRTAMDQIELVSCVRFKARKAEKNYIFISSKPNEGCSAYVGHTGIEQPVYLEPGGCTGVGTIIHELLHSLGLYHMQSASDRDFYVTINFDNVLPDRESNFNRYDSTKLTDLGIPYDYESIMHYARAAFSKNGQDTMVPKRSNVVIGQRNGLSLKDIRRINVMYPNCYD
uniref:Metalloendopeptidase n=1 Tax=Anopheles farauti TaxID=69004 RepID=A0A182Q0R1_9DIPT